MLADVMTPYDGSDASLQVAIMLLISMTLGFLLRGWLARSPVPTTGVPRDDLKVVEGIGPKIEGLLNAAGITTWKALAATAPEDIRAILRAAGARYQMHDPTTWPEQARLADGKEWDKLKDYQDFLIGGHGQRTGAGGFAAHVDDVGTLPLHQSCMVQGGGGGVMLSAIGEAVGGDVVDAHDVGPGHVRGGGQT